MPVLCGTGRRFGRLVVHRAARATAVHCSKGSSSHAFRASSVLGWHGPRCFVGVWQPSSPASRHAAATSSTAEAELPDPHARNWTPGVLAPQQLWHVAISVAVFASLQSALLAWPGAAHASAGALSTSALESFRQWLQYVDSLGNWGPFLFIGTVIAAEMVPLFPTQPISLAGGLLFGPVKGTIFVLIGVTLAAVNAFLVSRGIGKTLAKKVIAAETKEGHNSANSGILQSKLAEVQQAIASGSFMQQTMAIVLLRLTPVVPYSASNYILGLTPLPLGPFIAGTAAGMTVWSIVYASLGGASRAVLTSGASFSSLFADLAERAGGYSATIALAALGLGVAFAIYRVLTPGPKPQQNQATASGAAAVAASTDPTDGDKANAANAGTTEVPQEQVVPIQQTK